MSIGLQLLAVERAAGRPDRALCSLRYTWGLSKDMHRRLKAIPGRLMRFAYRADYGTGGPFAGTSCPATDAYGDPLKVVRAGDLAVCLGTERREPEPGTGYPAACFAFVTALPADQEVALYFD